MIVTLIIAIIALAVGIAAFATALKALKLKSDCIENEVQLGSNQTSIESEIESDSVKPVDSPHLPVDIVDNKLKKKEG